MSGSDRDEHSKAGLIAAGIIAAFAASAFIAWGLWQSAEYERQADSYSRHYAEYAGKQVREACIRMAPVEKQKCAAEASDKHSEQRHNQRDLVAQRQSALWAYVMAVAAVIGMGLSAIGVILVWTTFRETKRTADAARKANEIAHNTAFRQLRAYVTAESAQVEVWQEGALTHIRLEIMLHNSGATTATVIRKKAKFQSGGWDCIEDRNQQTTISPQGREPITVQCGGGTPGESLNIIARMFIEYCDYLGESHTEDSFWAVGPAFLPPTTKTNYSLICHTKIDETIGRFIDPAGEEADLRKREDILRKFQQMSLGQSPSFPPTT